jgi:hypothetical protein
VIEIAEQASQKSQIFFTCDFAVNIFAGRPAAVISSRKQSKVL